MSSPLQLIVPDGAQVHIHFGKMVPFAGTTAEALPSPALGTANRLDRPARSALRLSVAALLVFGGGYLTRGIVTPAAVAQAPEATTLALPPAPSGSPVEAVLGNNPPGVPSSIHIAPMPGLAAVGVGGQPVDQVPGSVLRSPYAAVPPASPYAAPAAPQIGVPGAPQGNLPAPPVRPRNPFGLE